MKQADPFYKNRSWKRKRETVLRRDGYLCRECARYGKSTAATTVHHIYPRVDYPEHKLNTNNLLSLCNSCHGSMHDRMTDELTDKGLHWKERTLLTPPL